MHQQLSKESTDQEILDRAATIKDQSDIGAAMLRRAGEELARLQTNETDSLRYGQLVVIGARVVKAESQVSAISAEFGQLQGGKGPKYQELLVLQRQLELSRLEVAQIRPCHTTLAPSTSGFKKALPIFG